jgi:hypothetical protein
MFIKAPIIVYTFDSHSGRDFAGGDNPLTLFNGSSASINALDISGGVYGKIGGSPWTGGAMTISFHARFDSLNAWSRVFDFGDGPNTNNILFANAGNTNTASFRIVKNGVTHMLEIPNAIMVGTKQMWILTVDASGYASVYYTVGDVNQIEIQTYVASKQMAVPDVDQRANMFIGRSNWTGDGQFDGEIDNFYVFDYHMPETLARRFVSQTSHVYAAEYDVWDRVQSNVMEHGFNIIDPGRNWVSSPFPRTGEALPSLYTAGAGPIRFITQAAPPPDTTCFSLTSSTRRKTSSTPKAISSTTSRTSMG